MTTRCFECQNGFNWGKFLIGLFDQEWSVLSQVDSGPLLHRRGWTDRHILILDLQTGESAIFSHGGLAVADLTKKAIWVCPMFLPFLEWVYRQDLKKFDEWPTLIEVGMEHSAMFAPRNPGPQPITITIPNDIQRESVFSQLNEAGINVRLDKSSLVVYPQKKKEDYV